jgi:hypothetical protein
MRRATRIALAIAPLALVVAGCNGNGNDAAARPEPITGSFVGTVAPALSPSQAPAPAATVGKAAVAAGSDAYVAIVAGSKGDTLAYVTDGAYSVDWVDGTRQGDSARLSNEGGATLDAKFGRGIVTGSFTRPGYEPRIIMARPGDAPAGLYRATEDFADGRYVGGWVVLPDGTQRGAVRRYETPLAPGEVDPTLFKPGDASFMVPGGVLRPELVRPSGNLSLPN